MNKDLTEILNQFPDQDRKEMEEIWELSKTAQQKDVSIDAKETETVLNNVHLRIEENDSLKKSTPNTTLRLLKYSRYLVAAIALIIFGIGYLMVPKTITVPNSEIATFELPDGSTVEMNSGTTIRYNRLFSYTNRTLTLNGEAYFSVQKGNEPFIVQSNGSITKVTGTEFNIRSWADHPTKETILAVTEGTVQFYSDENPSESISLRAGEVSQWNATLTKPSEAENTSPDAQLAWRQGRFVFQETPLIAILNDLERSFDTHIYLDIEGIEMDRLTAYYNRSANIETILEDICTVKGLRYTKTTDGYRIYN